MSEEVSCEQSKAEQWAEWVKAYEASGESQRAFCARSGIGQSTLRYWRRRLKEGAGEGRGNGGARWVAVKLCEDGAAGKASGLSVVAGKGLRIEVARGFDVATLERLVVSLRGLG